ncbi:adenylate/guanylate cyclase domain-containing protein, partial [Bacteroidota bacterium]
MATQEVEKITRDGERRQATVLFADISDFTSMSEKMDPEEVTTIVNECLGMMGSIIENNSGTVDKYIGDCVMALFGIPIAIEEAPRKAINTAIEIRNMVKGFNQSRKLEMDLGVHVGINTGVVITGAVGTGKKQDYAAIGDAVNVASRFKDVSKSGQIFIGEDTYDQTKDHFIFKKLGPIHMKGKEDPVPVFELLSTHEKIHRPELGAERMIASEMIGRDKELNKLSLHLLKLLDGEGSIISVIGEAGIGKSRLIAELRRKEEMNQVICLEGRALSIGTNLSFHPLIDILKNWSGIKEDDTDRDTFQKLEKAIKLIDDNATPEIFPFIATLMGLNLSGKYADRIAGIEGEALEKLILKNLYELIEKGTKIKPVVLIFEDLHWADLTSIEFFGSLYRIASSNSILFINVLRPGYQETGEQILKTINDRYPELHTEIRIESLGQNESDLLIDNLLKIKGFPADIKSIIVQRTAGNPFFIEEVARSFIDEGVIEVGNEKFEVTDKIHSITIPETISEVLLSRIDRLDEQTKSLLKTASVIGRSFFYRILAKVTEKTQQMDEKLAYLEEIQLIREQKRKTELEYLFKHALAQEATYESILLKKRKELHLKTAEAIELVFIEKLPEFYGMLAMHYSRGENLDKAEEYLLKAGEEALRTSASREAINYYREGLNLYRSRFAESADPGKIVMMEKNIGMALHNKGQLVEAIQYLDKALAYYGVKSPKNVIAKVVTMSGGLIHLLIAIYLPFLKRKRTPTRKEIEIAKLHFTRNTDIAIIDTIRYFIEGFTIYKDLSRYDLTKTKYVAMMFSSASGTFAFIGTSLTFALSRKILRFCEKGIDQNDAQETILFGFVNRFTDWNEGSWNKHAYDENLVEAALRVGQVSQYTSWYTNINFLISLEQGNVKSAQEKIAK